MSPERLRWTRLLVEQAAAKVEGVDLDTIRDQSFVDSVQLLAAAAKAAVKDDWTCAEVGAVFVPSAGTGKHVITTSLHERPKQMEAPNHLPSQAIEWTDELEDERMTLIEKEEETHLSQKEAQRLEELMNMHAESLREEDEADMARELPELKRLVARLEALHRANA